MRIISVSLENFASYEALRFDYSGQGLTQLTGLTGSGKSTLCDLVPWVLYGRSSKGGTVDEVLAWPGDKVAYGEVCIETANGFYTIVRRRGKGSNDLFYYSDGYNAIRGKDIPDTQKIINNLLGMDYDLYLSSAYYHEFSQTAQFFTTTAKNRRQICEQLVDLSLATKLQPKLSEQVKLLAKQEIALTMDIYRAKSNVELYSRTLTSETVKFNSWTETQAKRKAYLIERHDNFVEENYKNLQGLLDQETAWLAKLSSQAASITCSECGAPKQSHKPHKEPINPYTKLIVQESNRTNPYEQQLTDLELETNPHQDAAEAAGLELQHYQKVLEALEKDQKSLKLHIDDQETLQEVVATYRSVSIGNAISDLEIETNRLLTDHFDAEIRVAFSASDADKIDVEIHKDGNVCTFTQLSKGQRGILKLSFAVSVMKAVQNHHGIHCDQLFFDEATDGLDDNMRVKAAGLLEALAKDYDSIFLVDHSEAVKTIINNKYHVQLIDGHSVIEKA